MIETPDGDVPVENLRVGGFVTTADDGPREIRWINSRRVAAEGPFAPVEFAAGAVGNRRILRVSQQHRMVVSGLKSQLLFGADQMLAPAKGLVDADAIRIVEGGEVEYFHFLLDQHQIVFAEGAPSESFHPGASALNGVDDAAKAELFTLFPELETLPGSYGETARPTLRTYEAQVFSQFGGA